MLLVSGEEGACDRGGLMPRLSEVNEMSLCSADHSFSMSMTAVSILHWCTCISYFPSTEIVAKDEDVPRDRFISELWPSIPNRTISHFSQRHR